MKTIFGDTVSLKASDRIALEKLYKRKSDPSEIVSADLAKIAGRLAANLGRQIAVLIERDGKVSHVVLGSKDRTYLPDLGRYRLDGVRLRRLRLVVFIPNGERLLEEFEIPEGMALGKRRARRIRAPRIPVDFLTDLEKLRFDLLCVAAVFPSGDLGPLSCAHLSPVAATAVQASDRTVEFFYAKELNDLELDVESFITELEQRFSTTMRVGFDTSKEQALLVGAYTCSKEEAESSMLELAELARTAGVQVVDTIIQRRRELDPRTVVGKGKLEEIVLHSLDKGADILIFDRELSPGQLRSVTNLTELRILDRSMLILDIFAQRAKSREGRLQVELAQLRYSLPRLTEHDSGLSRLTGGIGGRGPGETKLEIGRRRARDRITDLEKRIEDVSKQRTLRRERRRSRGVPVVAIVGYTNAGKSTLLNALTKSEVFVENKLFATLDTATRRMRFPNEKEVVFVDTVGFIRELPEELRQAFRATLEEIGDADLLLHVADASDPNLPERVEVVSETLKELGFAEKPEILVLNKTDLLSSLELAPLMQQLNALCVSALTREGIPQLIEAVQKALIETFSGRDPGHFLEITEWK